MTNPPDVTLVIPTRDRPERLPHALGSALAQTWPSLEILVVDDGSNPPARVPEHPRVRLLRRDLPGGPAAARNLGVEAARGRWLCFLDDDDSLLPDSVATSLAAATQSPLPPPVAVLSGLARVDKSGATRRSFFAETFPKGTGTKDLERLLTTANRLNTLFVPREVLLAIGGFDETILSWYTADLILRLQAACSLQALERITYELHEHDGPRVSRRWEDAAEGLERIFAKHARSFRGDRAVYARHLATCATLWLRAGHWGRALRTTARAVAVCPLQGRTLRFVSARAALALAGPTGWRTARRVMRGRPGRPDGTRPHRGIGQADRAMEP